jgi:hypothetical protein
VRERRGGERAARALATWALLAAGYSRSTAIGRSIQTVRDAVHLRPFTFRLRTDFITQQAHVDVDHVEGVTLL